jgi:glyoxylase-like metal-dependent hydrolase (beta-lactamase superfamily II)
MPLRIGTAEVDRVEEQQMPVPFTLFTDDEEFIARRITPLPSGFLDPATATFQFSNHSWIIRVDGLTVLVDPCNGNGRRRAVPNFDNLQLPYLERLAATGATAETIDVVFCTHLHNDHCGWNTQAVGGTWVPTFPNAQYLFVDAEYRRWDTSGGDQHPNDFNESVFDECVRPVVDAGQARIVSAPHAISEGLSIEFAPGHTVGHSMLRLESNGARAYFTGDVFHHPAQVTRCDLHLPGCDDPALAIQTRRALVRRIHEERALLFPAHFSDPHYGSLGLDDDEFVFLPAGAPGSLGTSG